MNAVSNSGIVEKKIVAIRWLTLAMTLAGFASLPAIGKAAQPSDEGCSPATSSAAVPYAAHYYGAIDPYPIGYYPYAQPTETGASPRSGLGYYPYAQPSVAYVFPPPYAFGYSPYSGWPYGNFGWGWGGFYPYGLGF